MDIKEKSELAPVYVQKTTVNKAKIRMFQI